MTVLDKQETLLEQRLARLERQNHTLRVLVFGCCAVLCIGLLAGAAAVKKNAVFGKITAESVEIVDPAGALVAAIGAGPIGSGVVIYGPAGQKGVMMGVTNAEHSGGVVLFDKEGHARIGMGMQDGVPSIAVADTAGNKQIAIGGPPDRYGVVVYDEKQVERAGLGIGSKGPVCCLMDETGSARIGMALDEEDEFEFMELD